MGYIEIMSIPIEAFWLLANNVDRIIAEEQMHLLTTLMSSNSGEGFEARMDGLTKQMGEVAVVNEEKASMAEQYDRDGLMALKQFT